jgi:hypothetical protein
MEMDMDIAGAWRFFAIALAGSARYAIKYG